MVKFNVKKFFNIIIWYVNFSTYIIFSLPQIAKIWGTENFGIYSQDVSIGIIIATLLVLRLELLVMNDDSDKAKAYLFCVIKLSLLSCIFAWFSCLFLN